jgi:hypothetical protein
VDRLFVGLGCPRNCGGRQRRCGEHELSLNPVKARLSHTQAPPSCTQHPAAFDIDAAPKITARVTPDKIANCFIESISILSWSYGRMLSQCGSANRATLLVVSLVSERSAYYGWAKIHICAPQSRVHMHVQISIRNYNNASRLPSSPQARRLAEDGPQDQSQRRA